jgi:NADPH-dependent glutamate synthase beta subunit-like oxidoreductase/coenzyme F420-reducing hydrogenase delta subunit/ferredoxin
MDREWAPCRYNCPVHADIRAYVELAGMGRWQDAVDVIRKNLPFASVCGRICHHPCEENCRRTEVDEPVAIREIKRFVSERQGATGATVNKVEQTGPRVAIIGAGPAGLAAALDLAKAGYRPTVFEKSDVAGGIPATAIPKYRLPRDVLQQDVDWICAHGVELVTGCEIGEDKTVNQLRAEGFEAVLIATGLATSRMLPLDGSDHPSVLPVLDFLTRVVFDQPVDIGEHVVVIGGGNVAMDAARTAVRMGAAVDVVCLETREEMPAFEWEVSEAAEEGVAFTHRRGPVAVLSGPDGITALRTRGVTRVFDEQKRFAPEYDDTDIREMPCDTVIFAIGQAPDFGFLNDSGLDRTPSGHLQYNPATHETNVPGVFACGEIVTKPGSVVEACASGQRAAEAIHQYLTKQPIRIDDTLPPAIDKIDAETAEFVKKVSRTPVPVEPPDVRRRSWSEIDHNYDDMSVMREARRCMNCGAGAEVLIDKCVACLTCLRVCPFDIPKVTDVARIESKLCQACGMCVGECPGNAIIARGWDVGALVRRTRDEIAGLQDGRRIVAYVCGHHAPEAAWSGTLEDTVPGVTEIYLTSMSRLSAAEILHALENGADGVILVACTIGADRYPDATKRLHKRAAQAQALLQEIGLKSERIQVLDEADRGRAAIHDAIVAAADRIAEATG